MEEEQLQAQAMQEQAQAEAAPQQAQEEAQAQEPPHTEAPANPYDIDGDLAELQGIEKELHDIEASIENDFAAHIAGIVDNDSVFEELFFSDRVAFFKKVVEEQNNFTQSLLEPRMQRAQELQGSIQEKQQMGALESARAAFEAAHPDVSIQELITFFAEEVPPKVQEEIKAAPVNEFFELIYQLFMQTKQAEQAMQAQAEAPPQEAQAQESLPAQANGMPIESEDESGHGLPMGRA